MKKLVISLAVFGSLFFMGNAQELELAEDAMRYKMTVHRGTVQLGVIEFILLPEFAPKHAAFVDARIREGFYNGSAFHRVIPGFMIQGGDPNSISGPKNTWGTGGYPQKVVAEFNSKPHVRRVMSAARTSDPNSFGGQFFICVATASHLDGQYSAFGEVVSGMSVADAIVGSPKDANNNPLEKISMQIEPIELTSVEVEELNVKGVYPQPASNGVSFSITNTMNVEQVSLYSGANGATVSAPWSVSQGIVEVVTSELPNGVYVARINAGNETIFKQFVVMH